jgi:hypothetical protein
MITGRSPRYSRVTTRDHAGRIACHRCRREAGPVSVLVIHEYGPRARYDLDALPEDGKRYELADGWLTESSPAPGTTTQQTGSRTPSKARPGQPAPVRLSARPPRGTVRRCSPGPGRGPLLQYPAP